MTTTKTTPEQELGQAVQWALDFAEQITRMGARPSLARLRSQGASNVKTWMHTLMNREKIKHGDAPTIMAMIVERYFKSSIRELESDLSRHVTESTANRIASVLEEMRSHLRRIQHAEGEVEAERKRKQQEKAERFPRNRERAEKFERRAQLIIDAYDLADRFGMEYDLDYEITDDYLVALLEGIDGFLKAGEDDTTDITFAIRYVKHKQYGRAWVKTYEVVEAFKREGGDG